MLCLQLGCSSRFHHLCTIRCTGLPTCGMIDSQAAANAAMARPRAPARWTAPDYEASAAIASTARPACDAPPAKRATCGNLNTSIVFMMLLCHLTPLTVGVRADIRRQVRKTGLPLCDTRPVAPLVAATVLFVFPALPPPRDGAEATYRASLELLQTWSVFDFVSYSVGWPGTLLEQSAMS